MLLTSTAPLYAEELAEDFLRFSIATVFQPPNRAVLMKAASVFRSPHALFPFVVHFPGFAMRLDGFLRNL